MADLGSTFKELIDEINSKGSGTIDSINGLKGGMLSSPLTVSGGDSASASKIALNRTGKGQITDDSTETLFGFMSSDALTVGSNNYTTNIRGNANSAIGGKKFSDLAVKSDIPVPNNSSGATQKTLNGLRFGQEYYRIIPRVYKHLICFEVSESTNMSAVKGYLYVVVWGTSSSSFTYLALASVAGYIENSPAFFTKTQSTTTTKQGGTVWISRCGKITVTSSGVSTDYLDFSVFGLELVGQSPMAYNMLYYPYLGTTTLRATKVLSDKVTIGV